MAIYLAIIIILVMAYFFCFYFLNKIYKEIYLILTFIPLFLLSALRYNIGIDFINYTGTFKLANMTSGISGVISLSKTSTVELGYLLLNRFVGLFTTQVQWIFVVTSLITLGLVFYTIYKNSSLIWVSVYLFFVNGYIASFNLIRQYIAVAIIFFSIKYLKEKKMIKYMICVTVAVLFHTSALIFIPVYFLISINFTKKKIFLSLFICLSLVTFFDFFFPLVQKLLYSDYTATSYGMNKGNYNNILIALFYFILAFIFKASLIKRNPSNILLVNWSYLNLLFSILSMKLWIITRIMEYSSIFLILLIPEIFNSIKQRSTRISFLIFIIIFTLILYINLLINPLNQLIPYESFHF